jgi:predicted DNA-binding transcriptional regulator AlpA
MAKTYLSASTIYAWMADGRFPLGVQLSPRCVRWVVGEVEEWSRQQAAQRAAVRTPQKLPEVKAAPIEQQPRRGRGRPKKV